MSTAAIFAFLVVFMTILRFFNVTSPPRPPKIIGKDLKFIEYILKNCPHLTESYIPVRLWGGSGHVQSIIHALVGRTVTPTVVGTRVIARSKDGATVTWDEYAAESASQSTVPYTVAICPGLANSSESCYAKALVTLACQEGYNCIVLNHIGVLPLVKVTSPRIFRYGDTDDFALMINKYLKENPESKLILVGFSMGGNIVCKYLGEKRNRPDCISGGIAVCQGYDASWGIVHLSSWNLMSRLYLYVITINVRAVIERHKEILLTDELKRKFNIDERRVLSASSITELDDLYTKNIHGFKSTDDLYSSDSSVNYMDNIRVPTILINAKDDPVVHTDLLTIPNDFSTSRLDAAYIETEHGGHLAFYEGGFIIPNKFTWLDKTLIGLVAVLATKNRVE